MITGNYYKRLLLNKGRLSTAQYCPPEVFKVSLEWPGDFPGRTLLAKSSLYLAFEGHEGIRKDLLNQLNVLFESIKLKVNKDFYFGDLFNEQEVNEQQLAGNSWYIRGLIRYYRITKDKFIKEQLLKIQNNFLIPLCKAFSTYANKDVSFERGDVDGHLTGKIGNWKYSSDVGCAFIMVDGLVEMYELFKDEKLYKGIKDVVSLFAKLDYLKLSMQTHATLTAVRGILRLFKITGNNRYLNITKKICDLYIKKGMTLDYQNINWFTQYNSWTEPCTVVDSFMLFKDLYLITKEEKYLVLFNRVVENGLRKAQRNNGGAGCCTIAHKENNGEIKMHLYEAFFCCSMRLSEGLYELTKSCFTNKKGTCTLLMPESYKDDNVVINFSNNKIGIEVNKPTTINFYLPQGSKIKSRTQIKHNNGLFSINVKKCANINYELSINKSDCCYLLGDTVLTMKNKHVDKTYLIDKKVYSKICNSMDFTEEDLKHISEKVY